MDKKSIADSLNFKKSLLPHLQIESKNSFKFPKIIANPSLVELTGVSKKTELAVLSNKIDDIFKPSDIIKNSPLVKISKQFAELGKISNLVPEMSAKSILSTFLGARLYDSIIVSRSPKMDDIFKLSDIINNSSLGGLADISKNVRLAGVSNKMDDIFKLSDIINNSSLVKMYEQFAELGKISNLVPEMSAKSILSTFSGARLYDSIIVSRSPNIPPLSAPEKFYTPLSNPFLTTITGEMYEERIPLEQRSVPLPDLDHRKIVYKVLIVGGIADGTNQIVARFIKQLGFEAIILNEQPNGGRTKFGKFEAYTNVDFAITLLTPDDVGGAKDNPYELKLRPSQDTIFELAYLCQQLRPEQVFTLYTEEIELPSHLEGWMHVPMCNGDGWKLKLVREMQFAGLCVDKNKLL